MEDFLFLGLRMTEGVSCREFAGLFGHCLEEIYGEVIQKNLRDGLLRYRSGPGETHIRRALCTVDGRNTESGQAVEPADDGEQARDIVADDRFLALTDRGLDVSNYVMAQFLQ